MTIELEELNKKIYKKCSLLISNFQEELESREYDACRFKLNELYIVYRNSKITPKKTGQFVTFWKRNNDGITVPLNDKDQFDFYVINVRKENYSGQFILPKSVLINKRIISTKGAGGKRGFRVYPPWDKVKSKQAIRTQQWQLNYFVAFNEKINLRLVKDLFTPE